MSCIAMEPANQPTPPPAPSAQPATPITPPALSPRVASFLQERGDDRRRVAAELEMASFRRVARLKTTHRPALNVFFDGPMRKYLQADLRRGAAMSGIAEAWLKLVPPAIVEYTTLQSFARGELVVCLPSSSHLYELKQLLLAGLEARLLSACARLGLHKIRLQRGGFEDQTWRNR